MKRIHYIVLLLVMLLSSSCYTSRGFTNEQLVGVQKGMTLDEVKKVFGEPYYRSFNDKEDKWEFRSFGGGGWSVAVVHLVDGRVTEMETYLERDCNKTTRTTVSSSTPASTVIVTSDGKHVHGTRIP